MRARTTARGAPPRRNWGTVAVAGSVFLLAAAATVVWAQPGTAETAAAAPARVFSPGKLFTFLFMTLGPFKVLGPFAHMTHGRDSTFKRRLAVEAIVIAALGALAAATLGANILQNWGISVGALLLTAGIILFLVALEPVMSQYKPREPHPETVGTAAAPPSTSALAFSPLAFPTIITPYGVAVLILAVTLFSDHVAVILGMTAVVLVLDLLAMFSADRILKNSLVTSAFGILGAVLGVLQVALGVQAVVSGLQLLGVIGGRSA